MGKGDEISRGIANAARIPFDRGEKVLASDTVLMSGNTDVHGPMFVTAVELVREQIDDAQKGFKPWAGPDHPRDRCEPVNGTGIRLTWAIVIEPAK
jgi:hypothetical protein